MVKLTKAIIKKYGISKKAWAVARGGRGVSSKLKKRTMVKKRKSTRSRKSITSSNNSLMMVAVGGVGYGALRQRLSTLLSPVTEKIPMGVYADNVALGIASYLMAKHGGKLPMGKYVKAIGISGLTAEAVLMGVDLSNNFKL